MRNGAMRILVIALVFLVAPMADAGGLMLTRSSHSVSETLDRLESELRAKRLRIFAGISHSAGANAAGVSLRPSELLIFGNPKLGGQLFSSNQIAGIDPLMKAD